MLRSPNFIFFGSPRFASIVLELLVGGGYVPSLVVTNQDRPTGRKKVLTSPPAKVTAEKANIPVLQPETGSLELQNALKMADFAVVAAYAHILSFELLKLSKMGFLGVHPSLLPKYRGASPIQSAILAGEEKTGVTIYKMDEKMDHGPILAQEELNNELRIMNYEKAHDALAELGGELLLNTLPSFFDGTLVPAPQEHNRATFTKKITTNDAFVNPEKLSLALRGEDELSAIKIDRIIRALNPEPGAWTVSNTALRTPNFELPANKRIKLLEAEIIDGMLVLTKIQVEGKTPMGFSNSAK